MRVVIARPPLFEAIDKAFNVAGKPILFAFGDVIYNPMAADIPRHFLVHEAVHGQRQGDHVEQWWARYIEDPEFRLAEELPAHVAEYKALCADQAHQWVSQRGMRRVFATDVARRLASPLYGGLMSVERAKKILLAG